jgi:hypothetical protein
MDENVKITHYIDEKKPNFHYGWLCLVTNAFLFITSSITDCKEHHVNMTTN